MIRSRPIARSVACLAWLFLFHPLHAQDTAKVKELLARQRLIVIMFDGFGMSYYEDAPMPFVKGIAQHGFFKEVKALMPTVTNTNNASICCGTFPEANGITGNSFLGADEHEEYMESRDLLLSPTLFQKLEGMGIRSALISSKKKSIGLLSAGTAIAISPEVADSTWAARLGTPPGIYSPDVNYWSMRAAVYLLKERPDLRCLYIHTTDYPMHMWAPADSSSQQHLRTMDGLIQQLAEAAPDAMILITADHDMNHKDRCVDIEQTLAAEGVNVRMAISAERDKYVKHHRGFGGTSYVYLDKPGDEAAVKKALSAIKGVEEVLTKQEAVERYHLMPARIGDLVVLGDKATVFGTLEGKEEETLPANYRTHGSMHEVRVPLLIHNAKELPPPAYFTYNMDLTRWLFE